MKLLGISREEAIINIINVYIEYYDELYSDRSRLDLIIELIETLDALGVVKNEYVLPHRWQVLLEKIK